MKTQAITVLAIIGVLGTSAAAMAVNSQSLAPSTTDTGTAIKVVGPASDDGTADQGAGDVATTPTPTPTIDPTTVPATDPTSVPAAPAPAPAPSPSATHHDDSDDDEMGEDDSYEGDHHDGDHDDDGHEDDD